MHHSFPISLCLLISFISFLQAQDTIPMYELHFSQQIEEDLAAGKIRATRAAWRYTYIGREKEAIETYDYEVEDRWGFDTLTEAGLVDLMRFRAVDAREYILQKAADHQILIINESHILPAHRHFLKQMLADLAALGFTHLGLEALNNCEPLWERYPDANIPCDTSINSRGYPFFSLVSGTYTREARMANLIRKGHELGMTLFAYEQFGDTRELDQAKNIKKVLDKDPLAKIVILCGFGHLIEAFDEETTYSDGKIMAYHLKQLTGIDPLTVNQYVLSQAAPGREVPHYRFINVPGPSVLVDDSGKAYNGYPVHDKFDMLVFYPRQQYVFNRPVYLLEDPGKSIYFLPHEMISIEYPIIVKALDPEEDGRAAPVDVVELRTKKDRTALVLPPGKYDLYLVNPEGEKQFIKIQIQ